MGAAGAVVGVVFFLALYIAALTSAISLLEVVVSACVDSLGWTRPKSAVIAGTAIAAAGIPAALSSNWVGFLFAVLGQVFLIFGGLMLAVLTGYLWSRGALAELLQGFPAPVLGGGWIWLLRTVVPVMMLVVLYFSFQSTVIPAWEALVGSG